ncbi:MAG: electron transfer flavoprotein subunit alpha/FixB family protein [Candidatus Kapaibacterium sp.]|nr:MAG: electron transfer flavoprotein subunit alpha/FixB family protein [Candidatus Kapabacteria bacterium]
MKVLAYLEVLDGTLKKTAFETITAAQGIAAASGGSVIGIAIGANADAVKVAADYGLADCLLAQHDILAKQSVSAVAETLAQAVKAENADVVLLPASSTGKEIAPRLAVKLEAGYAPDSIALAVEGGNVNVTRPVYAGKARLTVKITTPKKVITIRPNVFTAKKTDAPAALAPRDFAPSLSDTHLKASVSSVSRNQGKLDVAEADIIVSGGRGLKGPENFHLVESLASTLGAAVGASRAVVDAGWRPHGEQVGQTGKTVSPTLYVAAGISGAVQHLAGMSSSKVIVAINKDKDAPIFQIADYGIIGDTLEVLPKLTEKAKAVVQR